MSETWTKRRVDRDGYREWRIVAGDPETGLLIAQDMTEADADAILRDHEDAARLRAALEIYGRHHTACHRLYLGMAFSHPLDCDCGLDDALNVAQDTTR